MSRLDWCTCCTYWLIEDVREYQQEDGADEVNDRDGDVERVGLLVHVGRHDADSDQEDSLDNDEAEIEET